MGSQRLDCVRTIPKGGIYFNSPCVVLWKAESTVRTELAVSREVLLSDLNDLACEAAAAAPTS